jgi:hypothetical protein
MVPSFETIKIGYGFWAFFRGFLKNAGEIGWFLVVT